jgi:hypothetical protein
VIVVLEEKESAALSCVVTLKSVALMPMLWCSPSRSSP